MKTAIVISFVAGGLVTAASRIALRAMKRLLVTLQIRRSERELDKAQEQLRDALARRRVFNGPTRAETTGWCVSWDRELNDILNGGPE